MEYSITSIKEFVVHTLTNGSEIKAKAESGDALSCFQMGMMHLLGINTPLDFEKASHYLGHQSLSDNPDANRLLGFVAECEGNYSLAFKKYADSAGTTGSNAKKPYINKVFTERNNLQAYLKKLELSGTFLNKIVTNILNEYIKGGDSKVEAGIRIAMICDDVDSYLIAAQGLFDSGDYYSAMRWLQNGNISDGNSLYDNVKNKISELKSTLNLSNTLEVIEIDGNSFLSNLDTVPSYADIKNVCDGVATECRKEWYNVVSPKIAAIKKRFEDSKAARIKREKEEEAARRKRMEEEERQALHEEQERKRKRKKRIRYAAIILIVLLLGAIGSMNDKKDSEEPAGNETMVSESGDANTEDVDNSGYNRVLSERKLSDDDLAGKSKKELEIMRNSIYARYGYKFKREDLLNHFSQYRWYNPTTTDMGTIYNKMNENEKYNVDFIKKHE